MLPAIPGAYKLAAVAVLVLAAYMKGCTDEARRGAEFKATVKAIGEAQEKWALRRIGEQKEITTKGDQRHEETKRKLASAVADVGDLRKRLRQRPGGSILPAVPSASERSAGQQNDRGVICFSRDTLRAGLEAGLGRFGERYRQLVGTGARGLADFEACAAWAIEQDAAARKGAP